MKAWKHIAHDFIMENKHMRFHSMKACGGGVGCILESAKLIKWLGDQRCRIEELQT